MSRPILTDRELDPAPIRGQRVAILGYGNQGAAHAQNLRDSGVQVLVGARPGSPSGEAATKAGFEVLPAGPAAAAAQVVMILVPDERQGELYQKELLPHLGHHPVLAFGHGFAIRFGTITPRPELPVILVAPVGPGRLLRQRYTENSGIPCVVGVHQDPRGNARALALSYAAALGSGKAGVVEASFAEETETDLFGEQTVICGGVTALIKAGFETLVEAGYPEELAYFECAHQMKLLVDLIHERGIAGMREAISNTAKYGDLTRGPRVIDAGVKARMKEALAEVQSGAFAKEWIAEYQAGAPQLAAKMKEAQVHPIEPIGARLRGLLKPTS
jgi:ketol-acid reductoisomerase